MRIVILISGRGSNMEAILAAELPVDIAAVISNRPQASGLETAARAEEGPTVVSADRVAGAATAVAVRVAPSN